MATQQLGGIDPSVLYPVAKLAELQGLSARWLTSTARRQGLLVRYVGGRAFVLGADWQDFVEQCGKASKDA